MVPIEQMDWTEEDRASKLAQHHPLDSTKRLNLVREPYGRWAFIVDQIAEAEADSEPMPGLTTTVAVVPRVLH